jgi:AcrR family transcriptional regulator
VLDDKKKNNSGQDEISARQKILSSAVNLFAVKGYTETSIRELGAAAGMKGSSIYNHFSSKRAIMECILEDYTAFSTGTMFNDEELYIKLKENPTLDGVMSCMKLSFPKGKEDYYLKVLCVLLQEQHRNPLIHTFVSENIIMSAEQDIKAIIRILQRLNVIQNDIDIDFWSKMHSCLLYTFASRILLGIGDSNPGFSGKGMAELLRSLYDLMFKTCGK